MPAIADPEHRRNAQEFKKLYARFQQNRDLISVGAYAPGSDEDTDRAIARMPVMRAYLQQGLDERIDHQSSVRQLAQQFDSAPAETRPVAAGVRRQLRSPAPAVEMQ